MAVSKPVLVLAIVSTMALACQVSAGVRAAKAGITGARAAKQGVKAVKGAPRTGPRSTRAVPVVAGDGLALEKLRKAGEVGDVVDLAQFGYEGYESVAMEFETELPPPDTLHAGDAKPRLINVSSDSWPWRRFVDGQERGRVPLIIVGEVAGEGLIVDEVPTALTELAGHCFSTGTTCVFVACEFGCIDATMGLFSRLSAGPRQSVGEFANAFVDLRLALPGGSTGPAPVYIAVAGGVAGDGIQILRRSAPKPATP